MSQELEIEFKNLLTKSEYTQLVTHFGINEEDFFTQENSYFDTKSYQLKEASSALRIRIKEESAEITLKTPEGEHLLETNQEISVAQAKEMIETGSFQPQGKIQEVMQRLNITEPVYLHTHLKTKRAEKQIENELLVLDQSWYANEMDFELEVETTDAAQGKVFFDDILARFSIPKRDTPNKIQRAFSASFPEK